MKLLILLVCSTAIISHDSNSSFIEKTNASIIKPENNIPLSPKLPSKHYPKPYDVIKLDQKRAVMHHIALALIPGAPESLKKIIKFYGVPKGNSTIQRLKTSEELERFTTTREEGNYLCYKSTNAEKKSLRVFFGANDIKLMQQYYASKATCKHFVNSATIDNSATNK